MTLRTFITIRGTGRCCCVWICETNETLVAELTKWSWKVVTSRAWDGLPSFKFASNSSIWWTEENIWANFFSRSSLFTEEANSTRGLSNHVICKSCVISIVTENSSFTKSWLSWTSRTGPSIKAWLRKFSWFIRVNNSRTIIWGRTNLAIIFSLSKRRSKSLDSICTSRARDFLLSSFWAEITVTTFISCSQNASFWLIAIVACSTGKTSSLIFSICQRVVKVHRTDPVKEWPFWTVLTRSASNRSSSRSAVKPCNTWHTIVEFSWSGIVSVLTRRTA